VEAGRASLAERGYLESGAPVEDLAALVRLRTTARVVAIADVAEGADQRSIYLYGSGPSVLEEAVDGTEHAFTLRTVEGAARGLSAAADPRGRAAEDGPLHLGAEPPPELEEELRSAETVLRLYVVVRSGEDEVQEFSISVASGPFGVWFLSGHADPATGAQEIWARRLGRASLDVAFAELLAGPVVEPA
jgi:hypothetical protein